MVREVPELMERSPREARQRWLRLTGRLEGGREDVPGSPPLNDFYLQVLSRSILGDVLVTF